MQEYSKKITLLVAPFTSMLKLIAVLLPLFNRRLRDDPFLWLGWPMQLGQLDVFDGSL